MNTRKPKLIEIPKVDKSKEVRHRRMPCDRCGKRLVKTEGGYICPDGHVFEELEDNE